MMAVPFAWAELFGDVDEAHGLSLRRPWSGAMSPKGRRAASPSNSEAAARLLDEHDNYRVLRRLKPRPVDSAYRLRSGESIALLVDIETTGLDHRRDEVIEIGMVDFAHDAAGRIGPVVDVLGMLLEPPSEIFAEITRLAEIKAERDRLADQLALGRRPWFVRAVGAIFERRAPGRRPF